MPEQLPLQHCPELEQDCPRGWQVPPRQLSLQQSAGIAHAEPTGAQHAVRHTPDVQLLLQQSFAAAQAAPAGIQEGGQEPYVSRTRGCGPPIRLAIPLGPSPLALSAVTRYQ